jgi:two-component system LytT family response regulator
MTVAIIDDKAINRLVIKNILTFHAEFAKIIVEEGEIDSAVKQINNLKPDLVFMDIELRNGTGFDIINGLNYQPEIIFTTAYSKYAVDAFKVNAFNYLLKPIDDKELITSINKCKIKIENERKVNFFENKKSHFETSTTKGKMTFHFDEIFYFESSGAYTNIITSNEKIMLSKNIGEIEKALSSPFFYRIHNQYIVNLKKIKKIEINRNGTIVLKNDVVLPLSQRKAKDFNTYFNQIK